MHAASLGRRIAAYVIDWLLFWSPIITLGLIVIIAFFAYDYDFFANGSDNEGPDFLFLLLILPIGCFIWWLIVLNRGQSPGKQLMGIRVMRVDGSASGGGWTFIRDFVIKFVAITVVIFVTGGVGLIVGIVDLLWAFWNRDRQTLHDKIMRTVVIDERAYRQAMREDSQSGL